MKHLISIFLTLTGLTALGQSTQFLQRFNFDSSYKIVGVCSQLDEKKVYQKWTFIIGNLDKLKIAKETITHGKEINEPVQGDDDLEVYVVKDKEVVETYYVSPKYKYVSYHPTDSTHGIFPFDISPLHQLADVKPISYRYQDFTFKSEEEFKKFLSVDKQKKNFLCWEDVSEELSGYFSVVIPKNNKIQKFKDGWTIIEAELNRITSNKKDYLMSFNLTKSTDTTFYYRVNTSKSIHEKFSLKNYQKSRWLANVIELSTIWLK